MNVKPLNIQPMNIRQMLILLVLLSQVASISLEMVFQIDFNTGVLGLFEKLIKGGLTAALLMSLFLVSEEKKGLVVTRTRALLLGASFLIVLTYALHLSLAGDADARNARAEVARLSAATVLILGLGQTAIDFRHLQRLLVCLVWLGVFAAIFSVVHANHGSAENAGRYVGDLLRAGSDIIDSNMLGGFIVICSMAAMILGMISHGMRRNIYFLLFVVCATGRFWTFSTGSLIGEVIGLAVFFGLMIRHLRMPRPGVLLTLFGSAAVVGFYLYQSGMWEVLLYRVMLSDDYVVDASVASRMWQYEGFWNAFSSDPTLFLTGVGAAHSIEVIGTGFEMHNSLLRTLLVGGVVAFICYALINVVVARSMWRWMKTRITVPEYTAGAGLLAMWAGWFVQSLTVPADSTTVNTFVLLVLIGVATGISRGARPGPVPVGRPRPR